MNIIIKQIFKNSKYEIANDAKVGWAGSLACKPGINIVSGTGSIAYGIDNNENSLRIGGWGPNIGDEGSAFWLGKKCFRNFFKTIWW